VLTAAFQWVLSRLPAVVTRCGKKVGRTYECDPKFNVDIWNVAVMMVGDERRQCVFGSQNKSKAACLRIGARVVAIVSDRFSTGR
jgi:hypothetical protein